MNKTRSITVRLPPELVVALEQRAAETNVDKSKIVREALTQYFTASVGGTTTELKTHIRFLRVLLQEDVDDCAMMDCVRREVNVLCHMINDSESSDS